MFKKLKKYAKYWYFLNTKQCRYPIIFNLKKMVGTLAPVVIGNLKLAQGMKLVEYSEKELRAQGKTLVGKPLSFPAKGCIIAASNKALAKEIILNDLKANAYSILETDEKMTTVTIQPYFMRQ